MLLEPGFAIYTTTWLSACAFALVLCLCRPGEFAFLQLPGAGYGRFIFAPWKVVTFSVALAGMIWLAPRSGDPTWDSVDAVFMSALTFFSAPWAVGILVRFVRRRSSWRQAYVAACWWLLSASWSYDLYMLCRDGIYPPSWLANMGASSMLYALAGLLWNLAWVPGRGVSLAFALEEWPKTDVPHHSGRMLLAAAPIMLIVAALMLGFFGHLR